MTQFYSRHETEFNGDRIFSVPFPYLNENDISVLINGEVTTGWEWLNATQIMVNTDLKYKDKVEVRRNTPIDEKIVDYKNTSMVLSEENLNKSHDQLVYSTQEIYDNVTLNAANTNKVIESMDSIIEMSKQSVEQVAQYTQRAADYAGLAQEYAQQVEYGVRWVTFTESNWSAEEDKYVMELEGNSLIILGVYETIEGIKQQVANIDIAIKNNKVTLTSSEAFDGGFLSVARVVGHYEHAQTLEANEWFITHLLGKYPVVTIVDNNGFVQLGSVQYISLDEVVVRFENPTSGFAYLS